MMYSHRTISQDCTTRRKARGRHKGGHLAVGVVSVSLLHFAACPSAAPAVFVCCHLSLCGVRCCVCLPFCPCFRCSSCRPVGYSVEFLSFLVSLQVLNHNSTQASKAKNESSSQKTFLISFFANQTNKITCIKSQCILMLFRCES